VTVRRVSGALALGLLVLSATPSAVAAERARHACGLLKPAQIAAAIGAGDVADGAKGEIPQTCQWDVDGGPAAGGGLVAAALERGSDARESFERARDLAGGDLVEIDGVGREAFFAVDAVYVLESKRSFFLVQALLPDDSTLQADLEALAEIAMKRA
jgi:hypothetical protein